MVTAYDVSAQKLIPALVEELKKVNEIKPASWAQFVKTGVAKETVPIQEDWWYYRTAAILVSVYKKKTIGVSKLRTKYGSKKNRGYQPEKFFKASGNIIRKCLQQLDKAGLTKVELKEEHKGRKITPKGKSLVDKVAANIKKSQSPAKKEQKKSE